jgi:L-cysteine:1D-myo-inositol 2-amino-2-deoxy-alpha-D-glucopyranoside ligase
VTLRLYDSRRDALAPFAPIGKGPVGLYVCGITPYDAGHLGHAFTYLSFDVLHRYLEYLGYDVLYVQNLTDVDDDMLQRAREVGENFLTLGNRNVTTFLAEMDALNWLPPDIYPRATQHIRQMQEMIQTLVERGHAYVVDGHVYYSVASWPAYGELSRIPRDEMLPIANERGNVPDMAGKRDPLDFVLWQPSAPDEPSWPSPWGPGRPGWHIECSAMSTTYLGPRFELHGGGEDLAFPHHESEIAQSEAATGETPFVSWWMHTGMLRYHGEKMSKSLGNLVLVRDLLTSWPPDAIRYYLVSHQYREELDFHETDLESAAVAAERLRQACTMVDDAEPMAVALVDPATLAPAVADHRRRFLAAMDDDLNTPMAMRELTALGSLCAETDDEDTRTDASRMIRELGGRILGLRLAEVHDVRQTKPAALPA